jgi:hypothetical protein
VNCARVDASVAYYCVAAVIRGRQRTGEPIPEWLRRHFEQLDAVIRDGSSDSAARASRSGHELSDHATQLECDGSTSSELIGAREAAEILGLSKRQVQRLAGDLDGQVVGGRWLYKRTIVCEYAEARGQSV